MLKTKTEPRARARLFSVIYLAAILAVSAAGVTSAPREGFPAVPAAIAGNTLSAVDKVEAETALRLKKELGDSVWPGLAGADIPLVLYSEQFEFLLAAGQADSSWEKVEGDDFRGRPYFRREAQKPQAFALRVGSGWAASSPTLEYMNGRSPFKLKPDFHVVLILHEAFHAFQALRAPVRFSEALAVYKLAGSYPSEDAAFAAAWNAEGAALDEALEAPDDAGAAGWGRRFLQIRDGRRKAAALGSELIDYERQLEWLEGLAEYAEWRFYVLAAAQAPEADPVHFGPRLPPFLQWDFARLKRQLGAQEDDLRFYLSGEAQARLLDRLSPEWKSRIPLAKADLEEALREALASRPAPSEEKRG
jgi:hypothetical protein